MVENSFAQFQLMNARTEAATHLQAVMSEMEKPDPFFLRRLLGISSPQYILARALQAAESRLERLMAMSPEEHQAEVKRELLDTPMEEAFRSATGAYRKASDRTLLQRLLHNVVYGSRGHVETPEARLRGYWGQQHIDYCEAAMRKGYSQAVFQWNDMEARADAHGIRFSATAEPHHRAAILDHLDNPDAPTLLHSQCIQKFSYEGGWDHPHHVTRHLHRAVLFTRLADKENEAREAFAGAKANDAFWTYTRVHADGSKSHEDASPKANRLRAEAALQRHLDGLSRLGR